METKRSYGRVLVASTLVLCLEVLFAAVIGLLYAMTREPPGFNGHYVEAVGSFLALTGVFAVLGLVLSLAVVLPAVALSDLLGRLVGGPDVWAWVPVVVGALLAPLAGAALAGGWTGSNVLWTWVIATAVLSLAALLGRPRRAGLLGLVAVRGTALVVGAGLLGAFALWTDIVPKYRPPAITRASVVGTWSDGRGGHLTFEADGRVTAQGIGLFGPGDSSDDMAETCSGPGVWTLRTGRTTWDQRVAADVAGCSLPEWGVAGRAGRPELYRYVGDPDAGDVYALRKSR
ncbi:hypothetical protein ACTVZO_02035 [Streptomyces sp. IBSNAI002]|uniref:hypothetical protein n=1 Tax=Streptomyces sp. IBSNAI002 TaxID=3457500 RepID=UPI003FD65185